MIAVDTNMLVYAHRRDSEWHTPALKALTELAEGGRRWAVPWPCFHEFLAIVTHPRIYAPPSPMEVALRSARVWLESPGCVLLVEGEGYFEWLERVTLAGRIQGAMIHDARVAVLCLYHGVKTLWTADRDFSRFADLKVVNPMK